MDKETTRLLDQTLSLIIVLFLGTIISSVSLIRCVHIEHKHIRKVPIERTFERLPDNGNEMPYRKETSGNS